MIVNLGYVLILLFVIVLGSGVCLDIIERAMGRLKIKRGVFAAMMVGVSLSLPELFIGIAGGVGRFPEIALGSAMGANLANLSLIVGGGAVVFGSVPVVGTYLTRDLWVTLGLAMMPLLMVGDGAVDRFEGLILLGLFLVYSLFLNEEMPRIKSGALRHGFSHRLLLGVLFLLGLFVLAIASFLLVMQVVNFSALWGVSVYWVGMVVVALGVTLPELFVVFQRKGGVSVVLPSLLMSVVINSTLVVGVASIINPILWSGGVEKSLTGLFVVIVLGLFWLFTKSKKKLERWEGLVLMGMYLMFLGFLFLVY